MANFDKSGMTQAGINLMGKAVGGATIQFTKLVLGDGTMTGEILDLQGVVSPKQNVDVTRIERNDNQCTVGGELLTSSVKQGFFWRECGLYAMDPDLGEILYNYAYSTKPDFIAASDSGMMEEILVSMIATVGSNTNVDVTIDSSMVFATKREITAIDGKVNDICVNVKEFGAIGDGVTDDSLAIQNAINYAISNKASKVFFPSGDFLLENPLSIQGMYLEICGASNNIGGKTRLICKKDGIYLYGGSRYITISNLKIIKDTSTQMTGTAIKMMKMTDKDIHLLTVSNVQVMLFDTALTCGLSVENTKDGSFMWNCTFRDIRIDSCNAGILIKYLNGSPNFGILFERVYCNDCSLYIDAEGLHGVFNSCNIGIKNAHVISLSAASNCIFNQCNFECDAIVQNSTVDCVPIIGFSSRYLTFIGCTFISNVNGNVSFIRSFSDNNTLTIENCHYSKKDACGMIDFFDKNSKFPPFGLKLLNGCDTIPRLDPYSHQKSYTLDLDRNKLPTRNKNTPIIKDIKYLHCVVFSDELQKPIIFCGLDSQGEAIYKDFMGNVVENGTY